MIYMGSKARIAKEILPIMLQDISDRYFVDLFCGGGNLIQFANCKNRIANDKNPYTIAFLKRIQEEGCDWLPKNNKEFTKENYDHARKNLSSSYLLSELGHIGYNLSFGGKFFGGFRHDNVGKRDYIAEAYRGACKQAKLLNGVKFYNRDYRNVPLPKNSIIYCDIPYKNTTQYDEDFNYNDFYEWCKYIKELGYTVYISEYDMPKDFKCIYTKKIKMTLNVKSNSEEAIEKLFTL